MAIVAAIVVMKERDSPELKERRVGIEEIGGIAVGGSRRSISQGCSETHDGGTEGHDGASGLCRAGCARYSNAGGRAVDCHGRGLSDLDAVCRADFFLAGDGLGDNAGSRGFGGTTRPSRPRSVSAPGTLSPARPVAARTGRSAPPVRPRAIGAPLGIGRPVRERPPTARSPGPAAIWATPGSTSRRAMLVVSTRLIGSNGSLARSVASVIWQRGRYGLRDLALAFERVEG